MKTTITINDLIRFADYIEGLTSIFNFAEAQFLDTNDKQDLIDFIQEYKNTTCGCFTGDLQGAAIKKVEQLVYSANAYINGSYVNG